MKKVFYGYTLVKFLTGNQTLKNALRKKDAFFALNWSCNPMKLIQNAIHFPAYINKGRTGGDTYAAPTRAF
jgi:hypothetical protein